MAMPEIIYTFVRKAPSWDIMNKFGMKTTDIRDLEVIGLLRGEKFYFTNRLKIFEPRFKIGHTPLTGGQKPTPPYVFPHPQRLWKNVTPEQYILDSRTKAHSYLLQFIDKAEWETHFAFETFPVLEFRKKPRKLNLKNKRRRARDKTNIVTQR